jgi:hypothetical protein
LIQSLRQSPFLSLMFQFQSKKLRQRLIKLLIEALLHQKIQPSSSTLTCQHLMAKLMGKWTFRHVSSKRIHWVINLRSTLIKSYQFTCSPYRHDPDFKQTAPNAVARTMREKKSHDEPQVRLSEKCLHRIPPEKISSTEIERKSLFCHYSLSKKKL